MQTRVQLPNGQIVEIATDDPQAAAQAAQRIWAQEQAVSDTRQRQSINERQPLAPLSNAVYQAASMGFGDEIGGGIDAGVVGLRNLAQRAMGEEPRYGMGDAYRASVDESRARNDRYAQQNPIQNIAGALLGSLPGGAGKAAIKGIVTAPQAIREGVTMGAAMGGASGAGNAQGGLGERAAGAAKGAAVGAAVGGAVPVVTSKVAQAARGAARAANAATGGVLLNPEKEAARRLAEVMVADQTTPKASKAAVNAGGEQTRALVRAAATKGPARTQAAQYADAVAADLQDRAIDATRSLTPEKRSAQALAEALDAERSKLATQQYAPVYAERVAVPEDVALALQGESGRAAIQRAMRGAEANQRSDQIAELQALMSGGTEPVSAGTLDRIRIAMGERTNKAFQQGARDVGAGLAGRTEAINAGLDTVPGLADARSTYKGLSGQIEAIPLGQSAMRAAPDDYASTLADLVAKSPDARGTAGVGYRQALVDAIGAPTEGAMGTLNRIATSTNQGRNLAQTFGEQAANDYRSRLADEISRMENARFIDPRSGSKTATSLMDQEGFNLKPSAWNLMSGVLDKLRRGATLTDQERSAIVNMATQEGPDVQQAIQAHLGGQSSWLSPLLVPGLTRQAAGTAVQ